MKIKFVDSVAGVNFAYRMGQVADLRVDVAREFLDARQAVIVPDDEEQAVAAAPENTARRTGRRRSVRNLGGLLGNT